MSTSYETTTLPIGQLGVISLALPKITFRGALPGKRVVIIAGQHGNEVTPLFVVQKIITQLKRTGLNAGELVILPVANPLGLLFDSRREPLDGENLNREAPGKFDKSLGKRIAAALWQEVKAADFVIDLHTFARQCGFVGVLVASADATEQMAREALQIIRPDCVWLIDDQRSEDKRFAGALDLVAVAKGTPAITLEMERHLTISDAGIERVAAGLFRFLSWFGLVPGTITISAGGTIPIFHGNYLYFDGSGIFLPQAKVGTEIIVGSRLGTLVDVATFVETPILSSVAGTILTIRFRDFVRTGTKLGSVGTRVGSLTID